MILDPSDSVGRIGVQQIGFYETGKGYQYYILPLNV